MASCGQSRLHCRCGSGALYVCACVRVRGVCYGKHVNCKLRPVHSNQCIAGGRRKGRKDRKINGAHLAALNSALPFSSHT